MAIVCWGLGLLVCFVLFLGLVDMFSGGEVSDVS